MVGGPTSASAPPQPRGAFVLFEGVDRSGKSTQAARLVDALNAEGVRCGGCGVGGVGVFVLWRQRAA
jgi:hypothetical protein